MNKNLTEEYQNARRVLEKYLSLKFSNVSFTENNKKFLTKYSVQKAGNAKDILESLGESCTKPETYSKKCYPAVGMAIEAIQYICNRYNTVCNRCDRGDNPFGGFVNFLEWWCEWMDENCALHCFYCGVNETDAARAFDRGKIGSKKFPSTLHIDRKDPDGGYCRENCVFSCVLCNNAKSDMISADDFKKYFGPAVQAYWEYILIGEK